MHKTIFITLVIALTLGLTACRTAATPCEEASGKPVNIKVDHNPTPAVTGDIELIFSVTDANCNPISELAGTLWASALPFHPRLVTTFV